MKCDWCGRTHRESPIAQVPPNAQVSAKPDGTWRRLCHVCRVSLRKEKARFAQNARRELCNDRK